MGNQRGAIKSAGTFFIDNQITRFRLEIFIDLKIIFLNIMDLPIGCVNGGRFDFLTGLGCRIDHWYPFGAHQGKQFFSGLNSVIGINTTGTFVFFGHFVDRFGSTPVDYIVEVDGQQGRPFANIGSSPVRRVNIQYLRTHHILPAVILKMIHHRYSPLEFNNRSTLLNNPA
jgi:hypothetical protein